MTLEQSKRKLHKQGFLAFAMLLVLSSAITIGCTTEADPKDGPVPFEVLGSFVSMPNVISCGFDREKIALDSNFREELSEVELVIESQAELDAYISCHESVSIDFNEEYVLAGLTTFQPTMIYVENQSVELINSRIHYRVGIRYTPSALTSRGEYIVKVKSKRNKRPVVFDVHWEPTEWPR